jgi:hypothetical protein
MTTTILADIVFCDIQSAEKASQQNMSTSCCIASLVVLSFIGQQLKALARDDSGSNIHPLLSNRNLPITACQKRTE